MSMAGGVVVRDDGQELVEVRGEPFKASNTYTVLLSTRLLKTEDNSNSVLKTFARKLEKERKLPTDESHEAKDHIILLRQYCDKLKQIDETKKVEEVNKLAAKVKVLQTQPRQERALEKELNDFAILKETSEVADALNKHYRLGAKTESLEDELLLPLHRPPPAGTATQPTDEPATQMTDAQIWRARTEQLKTATDEVRRAYKKAITKRLEEPSIVSVCVAAIRVGNAGFRKVYSSVWAMIQRTEAETLPEYKRVAHLAAVEARHQLTRHFGGRLKQMQTGPSGSNVISLYESAAHTKPFFDEMLLKLINSSGVSNVEFRPLTSLKRAARVLEKSELAWTEGCNTDEAGPVDKVCDIVRAMIVVYSLKDVTKLLHEFIEYNGKPPPLVDALGDPVEGTPSAADASQRATAEGDDGSLSPADDGDGAEPQRWIRLLRVKERFLSAPSAGGWRDCMINLTLACPGAPELSHTHVCEVQLVHDMMKSARSGLPGHMIYDRVRKYAGRAPRP